MSRLGSARGRQRDRDDEARSDDDVLKLAGFYVGSGLYGVDIMRIKEVLQAAPYPIRAVPHAPDIIEGIIQLRGVVIPVMDLRRRFAVSIDPQIERLNKLVIVSVRGRIIGLKVDRVIGELRVAADAVRPAPSMLSAPGQAAFFSGVCHADDEVVFVLNLEGLVGGGAASASSSGGGTRG